MVIFVCLREVLEGVFAANGQLACDFEVVGDVERLGIFFRQI